jgi:hypothetical protein
MSDTRKTEEGIPNMRGRSQPLLMKRLSHKRARKLPLDAGLEQLRAAAKSALIDRDR